MISDSKKLKKKAIRAGILIVCISGFFLQCFAQGPSKQKIIGISNHWVGNDVNKALVKIITDSLEKKDYRVLSLDSNGDRKKQQQHVKIFIDKKFDGIIIKGGIGDDFLDLAKKATAANIPLVGVEMTLPGAVAAVGSPDATYADLTNWMIHCMGGSGKYMVVTNYGWHPLDAREKAAIAVIQKKSDKKGKDLILADGKVYSIGLDDPINENYDVIKNVLKQHPDLKGIITTWGIPVVAAGKAVIETGTIDQISIIGCDADQAVLALMAKKGSPRISIMGWRHDEMSIIASDIIHKAVSMGDVKTARERLQFKHIARPFFVTNDNTAKQYFSPVKTMTPEEAWNFLLPDKKRPW